MFNPECPIGQIPAEEPFKEELSENEGEEEKKEKQSLAKEIIDNGYEEIKTLAENIYEKIKSDDTKIEMACIVTETLDKIANDEEIVKYLQEHGCIDDKIAKISVLMIPLIEKSILVEQTELSEQKKEEARKTAEKVKGVCKALLFKDGPAIDAKTIKEVLAVIIPENPEDDYTYIDQAGDSLIGLATRYEGNRASTIRTFAYILKNKAFQSVVSGVFRKWLENRTEEENIEDKASTTT
ncbi:MAG: hypothetical protein PHI66_00440 [Candidatus Pacebacteria bacterium]|nr:hypothetical protein [Candidatus Paceibacterota bacterium]